MNDNDKTRFASVMRQAFTVYDKAMPPETLLLYWKLLVGYDMAAVERALELHLGDPERGQFPPKPADIIAKIGGAKNLGHLEPNEAWGIGLKSTDESLTVCWTDEIAQAMGSAQPILQRGDETGARMAFIESYKRLVAESVAAGRAPRWSMSYGDDPHMRIEAERQAVKAGLLPPPKPAAERLEGPKLTPEQIQANKDRLAGMMRELADSLRTNADAQAAAEAEAREQERQEFEARKQRAIEELSHAESPAAGPAAER